MINAFFVLFTIFIIITTISLIISLIFYKPEVVPSKTEIKILKNCNSYGIAGRPPPLWNENLLGAIPCPQGSEYYHYTKLCHYKCPESYNRIGSCECKKIIDTI